ncbi:S1 RNA-binding domain-containing protein [Streptomyces sp. NPDC057565]|uniref:S1 RNA-binding domain-containing protein n=1 Tax=Streptomyces sp. NPDC057565 TaxID=3346169 RepID=UPI0036CEDD20
MTAAMASTACTDWKAEGLVHNSELGERHPDHRQLVVQVGDALSVKILEIDPVQRRITLSHRQAISASQDEPGI